MKPAHDQNCSCASCMYKSASERPSIRRIIAEGSRIDKLYFGKYIPLRERKLLDRLVRTRAVYDDIRNQLLSESDASMREKPNLKPRKRHVRPKDLKGKRSSAIIEIVDMVDKGKVSGPATPSECCNCCVCGSKTIHPHHQYAEMRRHKHGHGHVRGHGAVEAMSRTGVMVKRKMMEAKRSIARQGRGYAYRMSKTSTMLRQMRENKRAANTRGMAQTLSRTSMMIKQKMGDVKRNVRFQAKAIMSDPCTCTSKLSGEMRRRSQEVVKRLRPRVQLGEQTMFEGVLSKKYTKSRAPPVESQVVKKERKRGKVLRESYQRIKKSKARLIENLGEGTRRVQESKTKIKKHLETEARRSLEKMREAKQKINENIAAVKQSFQELDFPIRKDSIVKYKEKIKTRKEFKDYECEHECVPGECDPRDCFRIIKLRRIGREQKRKVQKDKFGTAKEISMKSSGTGMGAKGVVKKVVKGQERQKGVVAKTAGVTTGTEKRQKMENKKKGTTAEPRISIDIGTKKKNVEVKTKTDKAVEKAPKETRSVKSMTSIQPTPSKLIQRVPSGPELKKGQQKQQDETTTSIILKTRKRRRTEYRQQTDKKIVSGSPKGRQPDNVSSSFSFSLEVRKGQEPNKPIARQIYIQKKEKIVHTKGNQEMRRGSQTRLKPSKRDAQTESHALKRCFCTLKLKGKGYKAKPSPSISIDAGTQSETSKFDDMSVGESVQTTAKKTRGMACTVCPSNTCDPRDCIKYKKNKHHGVGTRTESKSISSLASRSISTSSKSTTARVPQKFRETEKKAERVQRVQKPSSEPSTKTEYEGGQGEQKQAVRISSSFSFNIEFYKDKPTDETVEPMHDAATKTVKKQTKGTHKRKHLRHKHSQISSVTGKSKYTLTKHSLRRCFCTLKLGQMNKKKAKPISRSTGSATSEQAVQYIPDASRDFVSVNKGIATDRKKKHRLLPHECEPGVCVPGECDPYACLELINKRQMKYADKYSNTDINHLNARHSNTDYRRTKSTSSFTSKTMPNKVKQVQSTISTSDRKRKEKALRPIQTTQSSPNRQVVRIGSSFSFNIEFYKDNVTPQPAVTDVPSKISMQSTEAIKKTRVRERGYQDKKIKKHQKSTSVLVKKKNRGSFIAPMKRCFCTLKLQTKERKEKKTIENATIGTETPIENAIQQKNVMMTKGTKTKQKYGHVLEPYECEPGICVPGECDPYACLQLIKMRQLKESSTATDKAKMKSATSVTDRRRRRSKGALVRSKLKGQKVSTVAQKTKVVSRVYPQIEQKPQRQAVRIGSTFSFDIEFRKDKPQAFSVKDHSRNEITNLKPIKKVKNEGAKPKVRNRGARPRESSSSNQDTQASISKAHKGAGIRPMLKRCFCTLKLQGNQNKKIKTNIKPPKVIAVSRVTVTETKIKSHKNIFINEQSRSEILTEPLTKNFKERNWATALYNFKSSSGTISKSSIVFRYKEMQSYFRNDYLESKRSNTLSNNILNTKPRSVLAQSNLILPTFYTKVNKKYAYSENCIIRCRDNEKRYLKKRKSFIKYKQICLRSQKSSNFSEPQTHYPRSQFRRQNYYTMNIQIPEGKKKYKLKPYECEPGICVPDECDPYECEKLIKKRLMKRVSRMSGANVKAKSMSSSTAQSTTSSRKLQSRQPRGKAKKVPAGGMTFKTLPSKSHKQAVRVGSSFSFNIEFSKDRSSPAKREYAPRPTVVSHKPTKPKRKKIRAQGTRGLGVDSRDQDSQSGTETVNRGSGMKPMMQRCFCTLKLQKKGKNQRTQPEKVAQQALNRGTGTPPNTMNEFISSRTMMNTGQNTATRKLLPYECEPMVCVPGECDPYECLERIKRRNKKHRDSGTGPMRYKASTGSMTGRSQYRTQGKQIQSRVKNKQTKSRGSVETTPSRVEKYHERPSKQAVRIGSSFSFNVEFFKENSQGQPAIVHREPPRMRPSVDNSIVRMRKEKVQPREKVKKKKLKETGSQDSKFLHHRDSQIGNMATEGKSTMTTSLLKRCFCTAKLHGKQKNVSPQKKTPTAIPVQNKSSQAKTKQPFLERCFCVMKKLKGTKQPKEPIIYANAGTETKNEQPTAKDKKVVTRRYKSPRHELEPYECEPGVCIPGECNPYDCEKLIKARNMKLQTREAYTDRPRTRSTSSNYSSQTSKARRTQSNYKATSSTTKTAKARPSSTMKEVQPVRRLSSDRQVVRIGSTFSFSVEFYKDRSPNTEEVQAAAKAIRHKPSREPKTRAAKTGKRDRDTRDRASMGTNKTFDQEAQANKAKMQDRGSGIGPVLKRCFCTLKLQKNKKEGLKMASQGTLTMKEEPTLQTRGIGTGKRGKLKPYECEPGVCVPYKCDPYECEKLIKKRLLKETAVMTTGRPKQLGYKLLPYECEPGVCVPGQCDPYECEKRIKLRNMKHRDSGTSTRRNRKSVSSDIRSTTSSRARKVQYQRRQRRKRSQSVSSRPPRVRKSLDTSTRQSVRIGSGFSFDVEFYKNKSNPNTNVDLKIVPLKRKVKPTRSVTSSAMQRSPETKSRQMQHRRAVRDTDSQILAQKMRNTGVNPFLKRCFCTLKLQKSGDMASNHKIISKEARNKSVYLATLLPYECEPGVCIPGECDPYECQKRIQRRLMRSQRSGTNRTSQDSSTSSTAGSKYKNTPCQSAKCPATQRHQKGTYAKAMRDYETARPSHSTSSSSRQAVRIGSSFKFDVEFYKDRSPKFEGTRRESYVEPKKRLHTATTKPRHRAKRSRSVTSSDIRLQHNQMQTGSRTESKSTGFGPRLKRCFCTLALHKKKSPPETRTKSTFRNDDLSDLYSFSRNVGVGTRKRFPHLKPYECEPGVCVPGSCDPYECYERIKRRMKDSGTATVSPSKKYASSITSKNAKYRSANTQAMKDRKRRERPTMANFRDRTSRPSGVSKIAGNNARQAVRIGSNFSFSVEFYKDRPNVKIPKSVYKIKDQGSRPSKVRMRKLNKDSSTHRNHRNRPSYTGRAGQNQKCQSDCIRNTTRGTTMGAFLKRCFCTLNLNKNADKHRVNVERKQQEEKQPRQKEKPPELNRTAMVQTRDKYTNKVKGYSLKPYECEPNVCIPGQCDPHECAERIRKRNIRRQSRRVGTHRRGSQMSVGSMASRLVPRSSRRVQSGERRARYATRPSQAAKFVEEPRFAHMLEDMRTGVKIGSNVSFDIEFYKDKSQAPAYESRRYDDYKPKEIKVKHRDVNRKSTFSESRPKAMHRGIGGKCDRRTCEAQATGAAMVDRGAGVNNMLKRCFCTLKLQKNPPKVLRVNRLSIEGANPFALRKIEKYEKSQRPVPLLENNRNTSGIKRINNKYAYYNKRIDNVRPDYYTAEYSHSVNEYKDKCKEMTTIYPYIPNKFNKNTSNTFLMRNTDSSKVILAKERRLFNKATAKKLTSLNKKELLKSGKTLNPDKLLKMERKVSRKTKSSNQKPGHAQNIKLFFHRIFSRIFYRDHKTSSIIYKFNENCNTHTKLHRNETIVKWRQQDVLKTCKSDRQPAYSKRLATPKKTNSLKVAKVPQKKRRNKDYVSNPLVISCQSKPKKYSHYQSGDTGQTPNITRELTHKSIFLERNNMCYAYLNDNKIINARSPYDSTKIVQMALTGNKQKSKKNRSISTTTKTNKKSNSRSKGVGTSNLKNNKTFISQCMCFINGSKSIKSNASEASNVSKHSNATHHSTKSVIKDKDKDNRAVNVQGDGCPCSPTMYKGRKSVLSGSGDVPKGKVGKTGATEKKTKKGKKVEFDEASINQIETTKKRKKAAGDAPGEDEGSTKSKDKLTAGVGKSKSAKTLKTKEKGKSGKEDGEPNKGKGKPKTEDGKLVKGKSKLLKDDDKPEKGKSKSLKDDGKPEKGKGKPQKVDGKSLKGKPLKGKEKPSKGNIKPIKKSRNGKVTGAKITIRGKGDPTARRAPTKIDKEKQPCICGTQICEKESRKIAELKKKGGSLRSEQTCICGSRPCALESKKQRRTIKQMESIKKGLVCQCHYEIERQEMLAKKKIEEERKRKIELARLAKKFKEEDEKRRKARIKEDKVKEQQLKKLKKSGDGALAAESLLDVLKLGATASFSLLRCGQRAIFHPKHTALNMKDLFTNPSHAVSAITSTINNSGIVSTVRRVRQRCAAMRRLQRVRDRLEANPVTRYMMYMCSKDARKRIGAKKKRMVRRREPIDFECSLFMASLRKRPCLAVYYSCPWFYPHCLSMLNLWKQFTDVMLFLVAVTVWSPCIVMMEICRAAVCCFFCTG